MENASKTGSYLRNQSVELVLAQYKFIYAVENSLCTDYVSEKWVRGLRVGTIPVVGSVNGFPDYTRFDPALDLPVYVNTARFNSSKDLAERLKQIGEDEKIYSRYMAYRKLKREEMNPLFVEVMDESAPEKRALCRLARILKKGGTLNFTQASQERATVNESCLATNIMKTL